MPMSKKHQLSEPAPGDEAHSDQKPAKSAKISTKEEPSKEPSATDIYYESDGLLRIHPYYHKYATHAKGRWVGRTIFDIFSKEFRDRSAEYYKKAIDTGLIEINGKHVSTDAVVKNGDLVTHHIHRHEPPVTTEPLRIVQETRDGLLVVDKPGSIPVHPSGRYNYNSVIKMLEYRHGYKTLHPVNRLDRLTSGLMLIGLNQTAARRIERSMVDHKIQKEYVCRVLGVFPEGKLVCDQPIRVVAHKLSLNCVDRTQGKPSLTQFERLSTDGAYSIVYCKPKTGRTHQIRVHLQYLGYPIANDPLYCNKEVWGEEMGRDGSLPQPIKDNRTAEITTEIAPKNAPKNAEKTTSNGKEKTTSNNKANPAEKPAGNEAWMPLVRRMEEWKTKQELIEQITTSADNGGVRACDKCSIPPFPDPAPDQLCIWLHAWRYSGPGWTYETALPDWAKGAADHIRGITQSASGG